MVVQDSVPAAAQKPTCFIAMPVATRATEAEQYGDDNHWHHVMESLFVKAVEAAGFDVIRPVAQGSHLIHGLIIRHLSQADLVLCDLSSHNPNVFFELGVRTSLNLPIALVRDEHTDLPFDTAGINTHAYSSALRGWEIEAEQEKLRTHITDSVASCGGSNPLWRQFGLTIKAQEPDAQESPLEAKLDLLTDRVMRVQRRLDENEYDREPLNGSFPDWHSMDWNERLNSNPDRAYPSDQYASALTVEMREEPSFVGARSTGVARSTVLFRPEASTSLVERARTTAQKYKVKADVRRGDY